MIAARAGIEEALGAIALTFGSAADADAADPSVLRLTADVAALVVDRSRLAATAAERSEWFERLAHTDPLTGLANLRTISRVLELELTRAGRQGSEVSVAIFDVDDFAATNEQAGREAGDDVLRSVASVVAGSVRLVDTVARYGPDEFLLVAPGSAGAMVARRIVDGIAELPAIGGRTISVTAGVATIPRGRHRRGDGPRLGAIGPRPGASRGPRRRRRRPGPEPGRVLGPGSALAPGTVATPALTMGPTGAVLPGCGSRVIAIVAPSGVGAGFDVKIWTPVEPTEKSPTEVGAWSPTITQAV